MQNLNVVIKHLKRASRLTLRILANRTVQITAPFGIKDIHIQNILEKNSNWILEKYKILDSIVSVQKIQFIHGQVLPFYGEELKLEITEGKAGIFKNNHSLFVSVPKRIPAEKKDIYTEKELMKWYRIEALKNLNERVHYFSAQLGVRAKSISLKNYKSRWGACSSKGDLIFNWQIVTFEKKLFDYVVAHEICHLKEMNHSPRFYALLLQLGFRKSEIHPQMKNMRNLF